MFLHSTRVEQTHWWWCTARVSPESDKGHWMGGMTNWQMWPLVSQAHVCSKPAAHSTMYDVRWWWAINSRSCIKLCNMVPYLSKSDMNDFNLSTYTHSTIIIIISSRHSRRYDAGRHGCLAAWLPGWHNAKPNPDFVDADYSRCAIPFPYITLLLLLLLRLQFSSTVSRSQIYIYMYKSHGCWSSLVMVVAARNRRIEQENRFE